MVTAPQSLKEQWNAITMKYILQLNSKLFLEIYQALVTSKELINLNLHKSPVINLASFNLLLQEGLTMKSKIKINNFIVTQQ